MNRLSYILILAPIICPSDFVITSTQLLYQGLECTDSLPLSLLPVILTWLLHGIWYCALLAPQASLLTPLHSPFSLIFWTYLECLVKFSVFVHMLMISEALFWARFFFVFKLSLLNSRFTHPVAWSYCHVDLPNLYF